MIDEHQVNAIHAILIDRFGGAHGLRDPKLLKSAISRPYQTFDGNELYPSPEEKAAAILESLAINHPFIDGNKRIAYTIFRLILLEENIEIIATEDEKYNLVISVSKGESKFPEIIDWIKAHT